MGEPAVVNPWAILKAIEDQYNYGLATGITNPDYFEMLQKQANHWARRWEQDIQENTGIRGAGADVAQQLIGQAKTLSSQLTQAASNAALTGLAASRQSFIDSQSNPDGLLSELENLMNEQGLSMEDAVRVALESGQYDLAEVQRAAFQVGNPQYDPAAVTDQGTGDGTGETPLGDGGGGGKPFEDVARDLTTPQDEFQKAFAQFTRQLETSQKGQAPNISVLSERYQDLFNKYLGEIEERKTRGEETPDVFKEKFVNIGKSTDPQFDQTTDRMQLQTVRPTLSAFDFLLNNVDPEDVYTSTPFEQRPGRSTGGYRGYVRRLNG